MVCISSSTRTLSVEVGGTEVVVSICNRRLEPALVVLVGSWTDAVTMPAHSCVEGGVFGVLREDLAQAANTVWPGRLKQLAAS